MKINLITNPFDEILRTTTNPERKPPEDFFDKHKENFHLMKAAIPHFGGEGLAAVQVGISEPFYVMNTKHHGFEVVCFPKILEKTGQHVGNEGCLSIEGMILPIIRPWKIKIQYYDINGKRRTSKRSGFSARVHCHEIDHCNGILLPDRYKEQAGEDLWPKLEEKYKEKTDG